MSDVKSHSDVVSHCDVVSLTADDLKTQISQLGLTQHQVATAWGVSRETVSRWVSGKLAIPTWVEYAAGLRSIYDHEARLAPVPAQKPVETPKPFAKRVAILDPAIGPVVLSASPDDPSLIMATPVKKPKSDDRPFRYMGGRKVYL